MFFAAGGLLAIMFIGWFGDVIGESLRGILQQAGRPLVPHGNDVVHLLRGDVLRRVLRRAVLRAPVSVPWLGGEGTKFLTHQLLLWKGSSRLADQRPGNIGGAFETIPAFGLPAINTAILLTSGVTVTIAHHALRAGNRGVLKMFLGADVPARLPVRVSAGRRVHRGLQDLNLTLGSGIYGSTFFMLTGFHGLHVTLGAIMLLVIWLR